MERASGPAHDDGQTEQRSLAERDVERRSTAGVLPSAGVILCLYGAVAVAVLLYVLGVLVPYYAHDLNELPYSELTNGQHDPKWLPGTHDVMLVAGFLSLPLMPFSALVVI